MNRELLAKAFGDIDEQLIAQAYRPAPEDACTYIERSFCNSWLVSNRLHWLKGRGWKTNR